MTEEKQKRSLKTWVDDHFMDTYQMLWMGRALWKSIYFGLGFSVIMVGASTIFNRSISDVDIIDSSLRIHLLVSFILDNITVYIITAMGFSLGLVASSWDATLIHIRRNFKQYINRAGISLAFSLFSVFVIIQIGGLFGDIYAKTAYTSMSTLNMIIACMFALSQTWRSFYIYAVLDKKKRRLFLNKRKDDGPIKSVMRFFIPFADPTQLVGSIIWAVLILVSSVAISSTGAHMIVSEDNTTSVTIVAIIFTVTLSLLSALFGTSIRLWNSLKPFGQKDTLYPYWEVKQGYLKIAPRDEEGK